jgi:flagellar motor switch protein FliN/FliY
LNDSAAAFGWLAAAWAECLSTVVESATGKTPGFAASQESFAPADGVSLTQPFSLGPDCGVTVSFGGTASALVGETALAALGIDAPDDDSARGTFFELLNQAMTALAARIAAEIGLEVTCQPSREELLPGAQLRLVRGELSGTAIEHGFGASSSLLTTLASRTTHGAGNSGLKPPEEETRRTLDLLLDVELPVSVSFGRARVALKDVLKLTSGSIVELNRSVSDPVEVIVNNCVIARGEVVVVDGNYGIRIQEILSRQERLRTLN